MIRWAWVLLLLAGSVVRPTFADPAKPNILLIFTDDQSYETIRAFGRTDIDTPNLDRICREGTTFARSYIMGGWTGAICVPSRTMLMTGQTLWKARRAHDAFGAEIEARRLLPQYLEDAGYETYFTGKWHLPAHPRKIFQHVGTVRDGMPRNARKPSPRPVEGQPDPWSASDPSESGYWEGGTHWSEATAHEAVHFIQSRTNATTRRPFFLEVAFNAPHDPRQSPAECLARYPVSRIVVPTNFLPEYPHARGIGCGPDLRDENLAPFPRTPFAVATHRREYYALITHLDEQIGRLRAALEDSGEADRTWIFFTSDNGLAVGHHGLMGKQNMYDHSMRVPFMVMGPGVVAGRIIEAPILMADIMPTLLELAGVPPPAHIDTRSQLAVLKGSAEPDAKRDILSAYLDRQRAIVQQGWKLIQYPKIGVERLYDLNLDPEEQNDRAGDPAAAERLTRLREAMAQMQRELDDPLVRPESPRPVNPKNRRTEPSPASTRTSGS